MTLWSTAWLKRLNHGLPVWEKSLRPNRAMPAARVAGVRGPYRAERNSRNAQTHLSQ